MMHVLTLFFSGTKLQWSSAITLAVFVWLFTAFWSAMPLIGWGEYDYEPLRTCCTLDYSKGDRYSINIELCILCHSLGEDYTDFIAACAFFSPQKLCVLLDPHVHLQHGHPGLCCHVLLPVHCTEIQEDWKPQGELKK